MTLAEHAPAGALRWRPWMPVVSVGLVYLALGFVLWVHAWIEGASTHTLCGCGDPALFLWFFQWPATALAHGENPFYSTALFHPSGINLLAQTSVTGLSLPLVPVTWIWGPVASLNVASTIAPALTAFTAFVVVRRWAPWTPAAFLGGLLYGFSPFVLTSLEFAHLMTAALMLLPLILAVLDEILVRQRHGAVGAGLLLGLLLFAQFFLSSELLAITAVVAAISVVVLVVVALVADRRRGAATGAPRRGGAGRRPGRGRRAAGLAGVVRTRRPGAPLGAGVAQRRHHRRLRALELRVRRLTRTPTTSSWTLGGYEGAQLASAAFLGWGMLAVLVVGTAAFRRDRRLWFFGFVLVLCVVCSLGERRGQWWEPARIFAKLPVIENVIEQRFMVIGFLAAAVMLAVILDRVHALAPDWRGVAGALAVACVALVPVAVTFGPRLPFTMRSVILPRWYTEVAPTLPAGRVLLSYPPPFSGIQSAMAWQAVNRMHYSQAGGGGPQGVAAAGRLGPARVRGAQLPWPSGWGRPSLPGTPAQYAAVRHALAVWGVTTVVIATNPAAPAVPAGSRPHLCGGLHDGRPGAAAHGAGRGLGVGPRPARAPAPLHLGAGTLASCVRAAEGPSGRVVAGMRVADCVVRSALGRS